MCVYLNIYKEQLVVHCLWTDVNTCLSAPDIWAADVLNKGLNMLNQLWEPVRHWKIPGGRGIFTTETQLS